MDGDGSGFPFPSASDFSRGQDATDISWGDMFLDGIHSDDPSTSDAGGISSDTTSIANIHGSTQQMVHQSQPSVVGGQVQIHSIPTHLQGSLTNNAVQQTSTSLSGTVAYLAPSASSHQHVSTAGRIQNVMTSGGQQQVTAAVSQQQHQGNAKVVQIAPSFPIASVQQLTSSVPLQTFLQSNQTLGGQAIYGSQSTGLFPAQGSVHIENPKVVNVNFGPHVIGSDGSGQQAIIQTAEGKRVLITNSQLQHVSQSFVPQSINLTQPLVGTQLLNPAGGNVIRASMAQGTHTIVPSSSTATRQIVLPQGQTVIPRQTTAPQAALPKNVVLRQLNPNVSPVIYQSGQGGQLIQSQPTLIASSGQGLQVVNTAGSQGGQVQLIAQPTINQAGMGQQQLNQNTIMNLINNQNVIPNAGNPITGLVPGQNILVNGQMLNIGQLGGLTMSQLPVQANSQSGVTLANLNTSVSRPAQFQSTTQQLVIQQNGQSQQIMLQPKNTPSPSNMTNTVPSQRLASALPGGKIARTPTPNANSASSTPVPTPTPSTPTPTPTPDLMSDFCGSGGKSGQGINILEQALEMSDIDLQSFEDDFKFLDTPGDNFSSITPPPSITPALPPKPKPQPAKTKSKSSKPKSKISQPTVNVTVNSSIVPFQQPTAQLQNTQGQKVTISPQQKIIAANGQVYVLSSNGQQLILQPSATTASPIAPQLKPIASHAPTVINTTKTNVSIPSSAQLQIKGMGQQGLSQSNIVSGQVKITPQNIPISAQQKNVLITANSQTDSKVLIKTGPDGNQAFKIETASQSVTAAQIVFATTAASNTSPAASLTQTSAVLNQAQILQVKNQKITTLGGTFIKQEPVSSVVKQEPLTDLQPSLPLSHSSTAVSATTNLPQSTLAVTTSNLAPMTTPLVLSSSSRIAVTTTTTQSHQTSITSTTQLAGPQQTFISSVGSSLPHSSAFSESSLVGAVSPNLMQSTPSITMTVTSPSASSTSTTSSTGSKSSSKEKDPAHVKSMTPIKIANTTLTLSLTPVQKERLENELSRMSMKDQNEVLAHQLNIIRRSQQVQQKQLEQQQKYQQQQKQKQLQQLQQQQQQQQQQPQEAQQTDMVQQAHQQMKQLQQQSVPPQPQLPSQTAQAQGPGSAAKINFHSHTLSGPELQLSNSGMAGAALPTTVQELMEKPEEREAQNNFQTVPSIKTTDLQQHQSQIPHQASSVQHSQVPLLQQQQQQQQQQQSINQRSPARAQKVQSVQQFVIPQLGRCLAEQQLLKDRSLALGPDMNTPFKNLSDAMRRLVRYHTLQDHKPEEDNKATRVWDTRYSKLCEYLVKKKRCYMRRFNKMKLYNDMCAERRIENLQNILCFNEQLREVIDREKEEAKNCPDMFEPMKPEPLVWNDANSSPGAAYCPRKDEVNIKKEPKVEDVPPAEIDLEEDFEEKETVLEPVCAPERSDSPYASPSSRKRKTPDQSSTGTLKLVFKRRTTDNFVVKNSSAKQESVLQDMKPMVNLEKSDSEYEFDSQSAGASDNQPVIVRRRTLSVSSQQASLEAESGSASPNSISEKVVDSSDEEEVDEEDREMEDDDDADEEEEDEEEEEKSSSSEEEDSCEEVERSVETKSSKGEFHVSFEDVEENDVNGTNDDACSVNADAFMETDDMTSESDISQLYKTSSATGPSHPTLSYAETNSADSQTHKKPHQSNQNTAVISDEMFNSNLSFPQGDSSLTNDPSDSEDACNAGNRTNNHAFSFDSNVNDAQHPFSRSSIASSPTQDDEFVVESPVSNMEKEAARKGLPSSCLFTTPNKSLLQTDAMFNSSSEDEDDESGGTRLVSAFEIDNKDPQSSMINDSVRSAINSVLNDNDDDDNDDSQTSWSSAPHRHLSSSSSSVHHHIFQPSSSIPPGRDADLDAAVQSILNNS